MDNYDNLAFKGHKERMAKEGFSYDKTIMIHSFVKEGESRGAVTVNFGGEWRELSIKEFYEEFEKWASIYKHQKIRVEPSET